MNGWVDVCFKVVRLYLPNGIWFQRFLNMASDEPAAGEASATRRCVARTSSGPGTWSAPPYATVSIPWAGAGSCRPQEGGASSAPPTGECQCGSEGHSVRMSFRLVLRVPPGPAVPLWSPSILEAARAGARSWRRTLLDLFALETRMEFSG